MIFLDILLPVFVLVGAGALFSRMSRAQLEPLTLFSLYLATPCLVFHALLKNPVPARELGRVLLLMVGYTAILWALAEALARRLRLDERLRRAFCLAVVPMNVGNYGLPLVYFAFGASAQPFSVLVFVVFNLPIATWAIWMAASGGSASAKGLRETLRIPIFHATVLAFAWNALGLKAHGPLLKAAGLLGEASIPLLLVVLGMQLDRTRIVRAPGSLAAATLLRLAVAPLVAWGLTEALGFVGAEQKVIILQTSTPAAVLPLLYALRFDCRPDWLASNLLLSTLASGASLWVVLRFLL